MVAANRHIVTFFFIIIVSSLSCYISQKAVVLLPFANDNYTIFSFPDYIELSNSHINHPFIRKASK